MTARVCEARTKAWEAMGAEEQSRAFRGRLSRVPSSIERPFLIPCPPPSALPSGCGAAAGEPCRESEGVSVYCAQDHATGEHRYHVEPAGAPCAPCRAGDHGKCRDGQAMGSGIRGVRCSCCYPDKAPDPILDVSALLAERDRLARWLPRWKALARRLRDEADTCQRLEAMALQERDDAIRERDALRASDAAARAALGARDGEETAEAGRRVSGERDAYRDHRDAIRILNTYRDTPSHMRGPGYDEANAKLRDAFDRLCALGVPS